MPDPAKTVAGRRTFSEEEKRRIVDEAPHPGVSLSQVARRYGIYRRLLFRWREELRPRPEQPSAPPVFAPVQVMDSPPVVGTAVPPPPGIEIELAGGRRVRFERDAEPTSPTQFQARRSAMP